MQDEESMNLVRPGHSGSVAGLHNVSRENFFSENNSDIGISSDERNRKKSVININTSGLFDPNKPEVRDGLLNVRALFFLILWYFFSGCTLFMNKYILSYTDADPTILGKLT